MSLNFWYSGFGLLGGGTSVLLAQLDTSSPFGAGVGVAGGAAIGTAVGTAVALGLAAFGTNIWPKPFLEARGLKTRVEELGLFKREAELRMAEYDRMIGDREMENQRLGVENASLARSLMKALEQTSRISSQLLILLGEQRPAHDHMPPLVVGGAGRVPNGCSVLLVEDDETVRVAIGVLLSIAGFKVTEASNLADGFHGLESNPDFMVLNLMLPGGGDGVELLRAVRDRNMPTKVIVTTGVERGSPQFQQALSLMPNALLTKPYIFEHDLYPILNGTRPC